MPDLWVDVDAAVTVPVNILSLIDDTDFKTRETSVAYNAAGMDLVWNFQTPGGVTSQTAVTPTTSGDYDWSSLGDGMYKIEMPASGGASINNDTEGVGWFTGIATGVLPWRGPTIGFRAAGLNDALIESAYSTTRGLAGTALPAVAAEGAGGLYTRGSGAGQINQNANGQVDTRTVAMANDVVTAAAIATAAIDADAIAANAIGASEIADGAITAAKIATGAIDADALATDAVDEIVDAVWDEQTSGHAAAGSTGKALTDAGSAGDPWSTALPGAYGAGTAGKILADTGAAVDTEVAAIKAKTDQLVFTTANKVDARTFTNDDKTGYSIGVGGIGATAFGAGAIDAAAIAANAIGSSEIAANAIGSSQLAQSAAQEVADEILDRDLAGGGSGNSRNVRNALRGLRNKVAIVAGVATIYQEDDSTTAWTADVLTTAGNPISSVDPS